MSTSELETLQLQFDSLLCQQTPEQLTKLVSYMKISDTVKDKSRLEIVRIVRKHLDKVMTDPNATDLDLFLRDLVAYVTDKPPPLEKTAEEEELARLQNTLQELKLQQETQLKSVLEELEEAKKKVSGDITAISGSEKSEIEQKNLAATASILRREFKISGQIGEPAQTDKLTYVSLTHQIDSGVSKGYCESEICDAVIKSISPQSSLRNYVLTMPDRSLSKLRSILRVFFQQKTASDLYQKLVTASQEQKETPQQFLLRALDARNKVFFAAHEESSQGEYSQQLVQNTFLKTMETGLRDENLVTNFRPFLRPPGLTDEALMQNLNELATKQAERKAKIVFSAERQRAAKANAASVTENDQPQGSPSTRKKQPGGTENETKQLFAEIKELKTNLADLKRSIDGSNQVAPTPPRFQNRGQGRGRGRYNYRNTGYRSRGCRDCRSNGWGDSCRHCFKCGESGHLRSQCPTTVQNQEGNAQRLFQGGEE